MDRPTARVVADDVDAELEEVGQGSPRQGVLPDHVDVVKGPIHEAVIVIGIAAKP